MKKKMHRILRENLEFGDLKRLVNDKLHIDEFKSKMGTDADVCVISFKVSGKEASSDLTAFIEKGYDFVLDADVSSGEKEGGDYLVFVELQRNKDLPKQILEIMHDVMNLTEQKIEDWQVQYYKLGEYVDLTEENLRNIIPLSPDDYNNKYGKSEDSSLNDNDLRDLDAMKSAAGLDIDTKAPVNDFTESLRVAAGIK